MLDKMASYIDILCLWKLVFIHLYGINLLEEYIFLGIEIQFRVPNLKTSDCSLEKEESVDTQNNFLHNEIQQESPDNI